MTFIDEVKEVLEDDGDLMTLLTGGFYSGSQVREISRQNTPAAFDANQEILPCLLVVEETEFKHGPYRRSMQTTFSVFFYQRAGYDVIEQAMDRSFDLLHEAKIGDGTWQVLFVNSVKNQTDQALDCALETQRFTAARMRPEFVAEGS